MKEKLLPSAFHDNKDLVNWLIYVNRDKFLMKYESLYKGIMIDLGCGTAPYKDFFLQYCDKYIGVDWSNTIHNSKADVNSDLNKEINLRDNTADTVISISVMEHLYEPQIFLNEAYRILKKDGHIILQVPFQWWIHEAPHDYFRYTPYGLKYMFEKAGFSNIHIEPTSGFFVTWLMKINYFTSRFRYIGHSKIVEFLVTVLFAPFWTINQLIAPILDKFDTHKEWEASGYFVTARK